MNAAPHVLADVAEPHRWAAHEPQTVRLDSLPPAGRTLVLALIRAAREMNEAAVRATAPVCEVPAIVSGEGVTDER